MAPDFGDPDAEWTEDYGWTRHRGPQPYPVPADWVLGYVDGDGIMWYRFPGIGEGLARRDDVWDALDQDQDAVEEHRDVRAILSQELLEYDRRTGEESVEHEFQIDGQTVFRRVDPEMDDLYATVAEALARYSNDQGLDDVTPSTATLPEDIQREQEIEQRESENQGLDAFAGGGDDGE